jgi:hypothetical protein
MTIDEAELEAKARADHAALVGKIVLADQLQGFFGEDSGYITLGSPARVRIRHSEESDVVRWMDSSRGDWLDPIYDVDLVEPHPQLEGWRSLSVYGTSYCTDGQVDAARFKLEEAQ